MALATLPLPLITTGQYRVDQLMFSITGINGDTPKTGLINANFSEKAPHVGAFFHARRRTSLSVRVA